MLVRFGIGLVAMLSMLECAPPSGGAPSPTTVAQNTRPIITPVSSVAVPQDTTTTTTMPERQQVVVVPLVRPDSPCQEWVPTAVDNGWPRDRQVVEKLVSIVWRESRCEADAWNRTDPNGGSIGLMQINMFWCKPSAYWPTGYLQAHGVLESCDELLDPAVNLMAGWVVYTYSYNRHGGDGWNPWKL